MLSVVVPTYCEADNIAPLLGRLHDVLSGIEYEVIIADDRSPDETRNVCRQLADRYPVRVVQPDRDRRDLSLSVIDGVVASNYDRVLIMDADLSHPPEAITTMLRELDEHPRGFVLGSRYSDGGGFDRSWSLWRFLNSHIATALAWPLVSCRDPMSGFFLFDRRMIDVSRLKPIGYKIGLELMTRGEFDEIIEVPIRFVDREIGESKMNLGQQFKYLRHLRRLYLHRFGSLAEFVHFGAVGASGFVVDVTCYFLLQWIFGLSHTVARAVSFWPAVSWNWALNRRTTFDERRRRPRMRQWMEFVGSSLVGFTISWGSYFLLTEHIQWFNTYPVFALIAGVLLASLFNFTAASFFVYSNRRQ